MDNSIIRLQFLEEQFMVALERDQATALSARRLGINTCQRCGHCCLGVTCVPCPSEIEIIANYLKMSVRELVKKYMVIDIFETGNFFLRFAKEGQEDITGTFMPIERSYDFGYCILYNKGSKECSIHPVRPQEARDWNCWQAKTRKDLSDGSLAWERADILKFVPDFHPEICYKER